MRNLLILTAKAAFFYSAAVISPLETEAEPLPGGTDRQNAVVRSAVFNVRDFGAKGDGVVKDTAAVQKAIDAADAAGGGEVLLPAGTYLSGSIFLK